MAFPAPRARVAAASPLLIQPVIAEDHTRFSAFVKKSLIGQEFHESMGRAGGAVPYATFLPVGPNPARDFLR
jgi:hypothetical protein